MLEQIASFGLLPAKEIVLIPTLLVGLYYVNYNIFQKSAVLMFFTLLVAPALKDLFKLFNFGHDFPSGHMFLACVFWLFLSYSIKNIVFRAIVVLLLCMEGWSLTFFNYHDYMDVFGGLFSALIMLVIFKFISRVDKTNKTKSTMALAIISTLLFISYCTTKKYLLLPYSCLMTILLSEMFHYSKKFSIKYNYSAIISLTLILSLVSLYIIFPHLNFLFASLLSLWSFAGLDPCIRRSYNNN